jgi:hypothetical protein
MFKASSSMSDQLNDPATALSEDTTETSFNRAFNTKSSLFDWLEQPDNELRRERFGIAMDVVQNFISPELILQGSSYSVRS